jgi:hypothetical protein
MHGHCFDGFHTKGVFEMLTKERTKGTRTKPARTAKLGAVVNGWRALLLTVAGRTCGYYLEEIRADFGRVFKLTKFDHEPGDEHEYRVNIDTSANATSCDCNGHTYRDRCKHTDALATLIAAHKL